MKRRLISLLLVALLVVSVLPVMAFAANPASITSVTGAYTDNKLTSVTVEFGWGMGYADVYDAKAVLQTALLNGQKVGESAGVYGDFSDLGAIYAANKTPAQSASDYGFVTSSLVSNGGHISYVYDNEVTLQIPGGLAAGTYYVYLWVTYDGRFYPDALLCVINVAADGTAAYTPAITGELRNAFSTNVNDYHKIGDGNNLHTHAWKVETTGNGTKTARTIIRCNADGCNLVDQYMEVELTASDVTLPGNVFNPVFTVIQGTARTGLPLTVSQMPGFKYSADGTNYTAIDPAAFEPKQGYYQASIVVMDGNVQLENLYVHYTVSDPVVTAATGDERPVGMMLAGMVTFAAMAAVAFVMDRKHRMVR